jgi:hypothetical protein
MFLGMGCASVRVSSPDITNPRIHKSENIEVATYRKMRLPMRVKWYTNQVIEIAMRQIVES